MDLVEKKSEFIEKVVKITRVTKVVKGGKRMSFSALVVVGDQNGRVGYALGKANEVPEAIRKGYERAKKNLVNIYTIDGTVPHDVEGKCCASYVIIRPATQGTGLIAGSSMRAVLEAIGIKDILTKNLGSTNPHNVIKATISALGKLKTPITNNKIEELKNE
jgi:small subunit ribosomal protein S5